MRIALISFEYPIDTNWGGIATYVQQAAYMLFNGGHEVEVFCGTQSETYTISDKGVPVHLCQYKKRMEFYNDVIEQFKIAHKKKPFDVIEVPEFATDAKRVTELFPEIAIVIKTHSPNYFNHLLNFSEWGFQKKIKYVIRALRSFQIPNLPIIYKYKKDAEYLECLKADVIVSPSKSLRKVLIEKWNLVNAEFWVVPNVFKVFQDYLSIKVESKKSINKIGFVGRLEIRKGILTLAKAIPSIVSENPNIDFVLIGQARQSPMDGVLMDEYLKNTYFKTILSSVHLMGKIERSDLPNYLSSIDICIFPSIWENFPNVCLEAMSAGKAVIASKEGGMSDMITHLENGYLINPNSPEEIVKAVEYFIENPEKIAEFGRKAREKVLKAYSPETILPQQIALYERAIEIRKNKLK